MKNKCYLTTPLIVKLKIFEAQTIGRKRKELKIIKVFNQSVVLMVVMQSLAKDVNLSINNTHLGGD